MRFSTVMSDTGILVWEGVEVFFLFFFCCISRFILGESGLVFGLGKLTIYV